MKLKKLLATVLTGIIVVVIPVIAGVGSGPATLVAAAEGEVSPTPTTAPSADPTATPSDEPSSTASPGGSSSTTDSSSSSGSSVTTAQTPQSAPVKSEEEVLAEVIAAERAAAAEADAQQAAQLARETGIPTSLTMQAEGEDKSVGEYMNNAVTELPGLTDLTPVAQGGQVIINGAPTNQTFSVQKPLIVQVQAAQAQAASLGGNIMNVTTIKGSVSFDTATVNFYMPGVTAGQNIQVYQLKDGVWNSVTVSEIREDHVVVDMTSYGVYAFIEVPAQ